MKIEKQIAEPSMEEILASIRQIISTDHSPAGEIDEDILDLTNALPEENLTLSTFEAMAKREVKEKPIQKLPPFPKEESGYAIGESYEKPYQKNPLSAISEDLIVSQLASSEAAQAFSSLNKFAQERPRSSDRGGQTVESLVRELLKPLLKEWLDVNLPTLVRWVVSEQVEKIIQQGETNSQDTSSNRKV
jgi:cell pole-organizing protein PopZ